MSFLRAYSAVDAADPRSAAAARIDLLRQWLAVQPRELFAELRQEQPIFAAPGFVVLTRHADVVDVLARDEVFSVQPYDERLQPLIGAFVLGSDDGPAREKEAAVLRLVVRRGDVPDILADAEQAAAIAVAAGRVHGYLDVVQGLLRPVLARFVGGYLGVPGPDEHTVVRWARRLGHAVFCDPDRDPAVADAALGVIAEFGGYIGVLIAARRAQMSIGGPPGHDALGRLLALQTAANARLDDRRVRELLLGVIACAVEPTVAAGARAILEIARRPDVQALARQAVGTGDHALLAAIVDEALRFAAPLSTPLRVCTRPYTLARGTVHETVLRPYTRVLASTFAAGFDPEVVEAPEQFRPGRPAYCAPKFGAGLHACVGRHIVPALLRAAVTELLRGGPVRAVADIGHTGPFPDALPLEFLSPG